MYSCISQGSMNLKYIYSWNLKELKKNGKTSLCGQGDLFHCNEEQEFSLFGKDLPVASWNIPYLDQYDSYWNKFQGIWWIILLWWLLTEKILINHTHNCFVTVTIWQAYMVCHCGDCAESAGVGSSVCCQVSSIEIFFFMSMIHDAWFGSLIMPPIKYVSELKDKHWTEETLQSSLSWSLLYPPLQRSWKGGILVSPRPSVRLSICGQNRVRSVSSTILIGSISYLHILSSNFRRCVACNARFKIQKFEILANFLSL